MTDTSEIGMGGLSERNFRRLAAFIESTCGIRMPLAKKNMLEGRLRRRVRALSLAGIPEYCHMLFEEGKLEEEKVDLINVVTTNKTDFFREPQHFEHLVRHTIPTLLASPSRIGFSRPLRVWSAASSTGSEPYTLAMVLDDFARKHKGYRFEIIATDICTNVLDKAKLAIYPEEMIDPVPLDWRRRYFLRSRHPENATIRLAPFVRQMVRFGRLNLMDEEYPIGGLMDVIFCRNILIYFDRPRQQAVLHRLCQHLQTDGSLFVGHADAINGLDLPIRQDITSVFIRERR